MLFNIERQTDLHRQWMGHNVGYITDTVLEITYYNTFLTRQSNLVRACLIFFFFSSDNISKPELGS